MYINYNSNPDFFNGGILVDIDSPDGEVDLLLCEPVDEDVYQFGEVRVRTDDPSIDRDFVRKTQNLTDAEMQDPVVFAIAACNAYGWDYFGAADAATYDWRCVDRKTIEEVLDRYLVASDRLNMTWR